MQRRVSLAIWGRVFSGAQIRSYVISSQNNGPCVHNPSCLSKEGGGFSAHVIERIPMVDGVVSATVAADDFIGLLITKSERHSIQSLGCR